MQLEIADPEVAALFRRYNGGAFKDGFMIAAVSQLGGPVAVVIRPFNSEGGLLVDNTNDEKAVICGILCNAAASNAQVIARSIKSEDARRRFNAIVAHAMDMQPTAEFRHEIKPTL